MDLDELERQKTPRDSCSHWKFYCYFLARRFNFWFSGRDGTLLDEDIHTGRGAIGNILFFVLAAVGTFMFLVGRWQEKFGIRSMITTGAIICGLSPLLIAYASNLYMLYLWAYLIGTSSAFVYIPAVTTVQQWYPARRGLVSGIVSLLFGLSAAIMSPLFRYMFESMGYVSMNLTVAILALLIGIVAAQFTEGPKTIPSPPLATLEDSQEFRLK